MQREKKIEAADFAGIYKDIAEVIGVDATLLLHEYLKGQQITFPKKLYSKEYIIKQIAEPEKGGSNIKAIASKYGYTERRLRQLLKENSKLKIREV